MSWTPHIHSDLSRGPEGVQGPTARQREATRVCGWVSEGKSRTGRCPMRGLPAEGGLPTQLYLTMGGSDQEKSQRNMKATGAAALGGSTKHKAGRPQILKGWSLQRWGEHLRQEGSQATLDPDRERKQTKFPWPTVQGPGLLSYLTPFPTDRSLNGLSST